MEAKQLGGRLNTVLAVGLAGGRLAIGGAIWGAPQPALRALGFDPDHQARTLGRLTATRDLATGVLALAVLGEAEATRRVALLNAAIDAGDAAAFMVARRGAGPAHGAALGAPAALLAAAAGVFLAARLTDRS
jgi:hypothetical protein